MRYATIQFGFSKESFLILKFFLISGGYPNLSACYSRFNFNPWTFFNNFKYGKFWVCKNLDNYIQITRFLRNFLKNFKNQSRSLNRNYQTSSLNIKRKQNKKEKRKRFWFLMILGEGVWGFCSNLIVFYSWIFWKVSRNFGNTYCVF